MKSGIYNMDCMEAMKEFPDNFFELAIIDPPYGLGLDMINKVDSNKRQNRKNRTIVKHKDKGWNDNIPSPEYFIELHRVSKNQIIWGCNYYAKYIPAVGRIVHDKIMGTEKTKFNWSHADIASCSLFRRIVMFRYQWAGNKQNGTINWDNSGPDGRIHPTQKPISLYEYCLMNYAKEGDKILDTHLGSGSSAIAAHKLGYEFWGYEIDKDYFKATKKRINLEKTKLQLF